MGSTATAVNGNRVSWVSITLDADGLPIGGITAIDYSDSLSPGGASWTGEPSGTDPIALGYTRGKYTASCAITMYRSEWEKFKTRLGAGGVGFMESTAIFNCSYTDAGAGVPVTDTVVGRVAKVESSNADGTDAARVKLTVNVMSPILWNGSPGVIPDPTALDIAFV